MSQAVITQNDVRLARQALQATGIPEPGILRIRTQLGGRGSTQLITRYRDELREEEAGARAARDAEDLTDQRLARSPLPAPALQGLTQAWLALLDVRDQDRLTLEDHLDHQLAEHEAQREASEAAFAALKKDTDALTAHAAGLQGALDTVREAREQAEQAHVRALSERDQALTEKDKALAESTAALTEVRGHVEVLSQALTEQNRLAEQREAARVGELNALNEKLEARDRQILAQRRDHQTHVEALNNTWQKKLSETEGTLKRQQAQLASTTQALEGGLKAKTESEARAARLERENAALTQRLEDALSRHDSLQTRLGDLTARLADQSQQLHQLIQRQSDPSGNTA